MKFVCGQCQSKYTIADDKVRGKVLKIRCVKCGSLVEVRGPAAPDKAPGAAAAGRPEPKAAAEPAMAAAAKGGAAPRSVLEDKFAASFKAPAGGGGGRAAAKAAGTPGLFQAVQRSAEKIDKDETALPVWFVAIDKTPHGPISARAVHKHQKAGKVGDDSLVWKEGMADWTRLRNCKELFGLLARLDIESAIGAAPAAEPPKPAVRLGLFAEREREGAAQAESPLRGRSLGVPSDRAPEPEAEPAPGPAPVARKPEAAAAAPAAGGPAKEALEDEFFGGAGAGIGSIQAITPPRPARSDRWIKFAAIGFFGVAVVVLVIVVFSQGEPAVREVVQQVFVDRVVEKERIVYRDRENAAAGGAEAAVDPGGNRKVGNRPTKGKDGDKPPAEETPEEKKRRLLMEQLGSGPDGAAPISSGSGAAASGKGSGGGEQGLSQKDLAKVAQGNQSGVQACYEQSLKRAEVPEDSPVKVEVALKVGASGMVKSAAVTGPGAQYAGLKGCIEKSAKRWVFPASSAESSAVFPYLFKPK